MLKKQVPIEIRIKTVVEVPADWNEDQIKFWACENHCISNEITALAERDPEDSCSLCADAEVVLLSDSEHPDLLERYRQKPL
jgi:hypothetical protein